MTGTTISNHHSVDRTGDTDTRRVLQSTSIPAPRFHYSPCIQVGSLIHVSGMVGLDTTTGELVDGGPGVEVQQIFDNLQRAMPDYGVTFADLIIARIFTTRFDRFTEINTAWERALASVSVPPARTAIGVSALPLGATVEIEFTFATPPARAASTTPAVDASFFDL